MAQTKGEVEMAGQWPSISFIHFFLVFLAGEGSLCTGQAWSMKDLSFSENNLFSRRE